MATRPEGQIDLAELKLTAGEARRLTVDAPIRDITIGEEHYSVSPSPVPMTVDVSRMVGGGWSLHTTFTATLHGRCVRCLEDAEPEYHVDVREVDVPDEGPELDSPYVDADVVDFASWARDSLVLELPSQVLCRPDCLGLCPVCGVDRNSDPGHAHEAEPDKRWAKLAELKFDD
jgi:uncharacterized protein